METARTPAELVFAELTVGPPCRRRKASIFNYLGICWVFAAQGCRGAASARGTCYRLTSKGQKA